MSGEQNGWGEIVLRVIANSCKIRFLVGSDSKKVYKNPDQKGPGNWYFSRDTDHVTGTEDLGNG